MKQVRDGLMILKLYRKIPTLAFIKITAKHANVGIFLYRYKIIKLSYTSFYYLTEPPTGKQLGHFSLGPTELRALVVGPSYIIQQD